MDTTPQPTRSRPGFDWLVILLFLAAIILPLVRQVLGTSSGTEAHEKRELAPLPPRPQTWAALWQFPALYAAYFGDHFGFRGDLIRLHALAIYRGLGISPSGSVLVGRDNWLYYADDYSLEDYRSLRPFTQAELERWREALAEQQTWLAKRNTRLLVVLACDKYVIYPEYLPSSIHRVPGPYRVDQLADYLREHSDIPVVALRDPLMEAKARDRVYHRTDTHWNDRGAHVGYLEITTRLHEWFPGVEPQPRDAFKPVAAVSEGWDLARMMGLEDIVPEENLSLAPRTPRRARVVELDHPDALWNNGRIALERDDALLPRAVILRDSFFSALVPFLAEHFRRSLFLWQYYWDEPLIEREKPDVVIFEITSRRLQWFTPANPPLQ